MTFNQIVIIDLAGVSRQQKPSDGLLCFYASAVVTVLSARVKMAVSKEQSGGGGVVTCVPPRLRVPMDSLGIAACKGVGGWGDVVFFFFIFWGGGEIGLSAVFTK